MVATQITPEQVKNLDAFVQATMSAHAKGAWSSATAYVVNDWVTYLGTSYYALQAGTNQNPASSPTYWGVLAAKGDTGATGATGPTGPAGSGGSGGGGGSVPAPVVHRRTAGNVNISGTTGMAVDTSLDIAISNLIVGDWVELCIVAAWAGGVSYAILDMASMVSGSPVNYISSGTGTAAGFGVSSWMAHGDDVGVSGVVTYQIQAGDLSSGTATFRLLGRTANGGTRLLYADGVSLPLLVWGRKISGGAGGSSVADAYKGAWSAATSYVRGDLVSANGTLYVAKNTITAGALTQPVVQKQQSGTGAVMNGGSIAAHSLGAVGDDQLLIVGTHSSVVPTTPTGWTAVTSATGAHVKISTFKRTIDSGNIASAVNVVWADNGQARMITFVGTIGVTAGLSGTSLTSTGETVIGTLLRIWGESNSNSSGGGGNVLTPPGSGLNNSSGAATYTYFGGIIHGLDDTAAGGTAPTLTASSTGGWGRYPEFLNLNLGSSPSTFSPGSNWQEVATAAPSSSAPLGRTWPIDLRPATPNLMDDEFSGTSLDPKWTLTYASTSPPTLTWLGDGLQFEPQIQAGWLLQGLTQPLPSSGDWEFILGVAGLDGRTRDFNQPILIGIAEGATAGDLTKKVRFLGMTRFTQSNLSLETAELPSWSSASGTSFSDSANMHQNDGYLRAKKVGTTYSLSYSATGRKFVDLFSSTLGFTPGRIVIGGKTEHTTSTEGTLALLKWFRRTA